MNENQVWVLHQSSSSVFQYKSKYIPLQRNMSNNPKISIIFFLFTEQMYLLE